MKLAALLLVGSAVGCRAKPAEVFSCGQSLSGTWRTERGDWALIDSAQSIDAFPQFDDSRPAEADPTLEVAPRTIHLVRTDGKLGGQVLRRYMHGADACIATASVHVLACHGTTLELTIADPTVPLAFTPCSFSARTNPSRKETWRRVY